MDTSPNPVNVKILAAVTCFLLAAVMAMSFIQHSTQRGVSVAFPASVPTAWCYLELSSHWSISKLKQIAQVGTAIVLIGVAGDLLFETAMGGIAILAQLCAMLIVVESAKLPNATVMDSTSDRTRIRQLVMKNLLAVAVTECLILAVLAMHIPNLPTVGVPTFLLAATITIVIASHLTGRVLMLGRNDKDANSRG